MIRDWLIPMGLDYNHGYAKAPVVNSEVSKKREALEKRLSNVQRFREAARIKAHRATLLSTRLRKEAKEHGDRLYRALNERLQALEAQGVTEGRYWVERRKQKADVDAELETIGSGCIAWRQKAPRRAISTSGTAVSSGNFCGRWKS